MNAKQKLIEKQEKELYEKAVLKEMVELLLDTITFDTAIQKKLKGLDVIAKFKEVSQCLYRKQAELNVRERGC